MCEYSTTDAPWPSTHLTRGAGEKWSNLLKKRAVTHVGGKPRAPDVQCFEHPRVAQLAEHGWRVKARRALVQV